MAPGRRCQKSDADSTHPEIITVSWLGCGMWGSAEGSSFPFPSKRKERWGTRLAVALGMGETEVWDGSMKWGGCEGAQHNQAGMWMVHWHGAWQSG